MERALFFFIFRSRVINGVKSWYKKKSYSPENGTCVRRQTSFSAIFILNKITVPIFLVIYIRQDPQPLHQQRY